MKINFMRKVDFLLGVPICFIFTIVHKVLSFLRVGTGKKAVRNILFIELSEMGSAILAYSSLQAAKKLYPGANLYFLIFEKNKESINLLNVIPKKNIITIRSDSFLKFAFGTLSALLRIRKAKIDTTIDMELFSRATSVLSYLSGAKKRVGFYKFHQEGLYRGDHMTHKVNYNPHQHISVNFLNLVYSLKSPLNEYPMLKKNIIDKPNVPRLKITKEAEDKILEKLKKENSRINRSSYIIVFNPDAGLLPIRGWPLEKYVELAKKLLKFKDVFIIVMGVKDASRYAKAICKVNEKRCIDLTNKTTLEEVIDLFNVSKILVTNDSGPAHFASLTGIYNIVFFGPETPKLYGPLGDKGISVYSDFSCSPCLNAYNHRETSCKDNLCLKTIPSDHVFNIIKKIKK